ncbi:hypothetical protein O6H91_08G021600 [Diphasiastrum complanatum]|uniref:Uncharacterized protein n=1 Tax=Diphasiastrum complanatum TaxID=34168 RepID=A0ACC2CVK7_DIPCM|nr:hypothetical protein O6H91_08G021600 [Diphasiastrum complanatum]
MEMWRNPFAKKSPDLQQIHLDVSDLEDDKESLDQVVYDEDWSSKLASLYHRKNLVCFISFYRVFFMCVLSCFACIQKIMLIYCILEHNPHNHYGHVVKHYTIGPLFDSASRFSNRVNIMGTIMFQPINGFIHHLLSEKGALKGLGEMLIAMGWVLHITS